MSDELRQVDRVMLGMLGKVMRELENFASGAEFSVYAAKDWEMRQHTIHALLTEQPEPDAPQGAKERLAEVLRLIRRGRHYEREVQQGSLVAKAQLENLKIVLYDYCDAIEGRTALPTSVEQEGLRWIDYDEMKAERDQYKEKLSRLEGLVGEYKASWFVEGGFVKPADVNAVSRTRVRLFAYLDKLAAERPTPDTEREEQR